MPRDNLTPNPDWKTYRAGQADRAGREIDRVYALGDDYVIYFSGCELFYEIEPTIKQDLGNADVALARINRLLPLVNAENAKSFAYQHKYSILELVADAYEMIFCGEVPEGLTILNDIRDKLQTTAEGQRRLFYQGGAVFTALLGWIIYLALHTPSFMPAGWEPWILAAALAMAGGAFSVCLNVGSLQVSINQQGSFLLVAGATRAVVALLAGIGALLAMRASMIAGFAYKSMTPAIRDGLVSAEMFFCFLAGFSETFVPNILRDSERSSGGARATEQAKTAAQIAEQADTAQETKTSQERKAGTVGASTEQAKTAEQQSAGQAKTGQDAKSKQETKKADTVPSGSDPAKTAEQKSADEADAPLDMKTTEETSRANTAVVATAQTTTAEQAKNAQGAKTGQSVTNQQQAAATVTDQDKTAERPRGEDAKAAQQTKNENRTQG